MNRLIRILCFLSPLLFLQHVPVNAATGDSSRLRISLLTCGVGEEVWETFGHTAIRIVDSVAGTDNVYNYGTFNGYEEGFELKFMQGKLLYYVSSYPYPYFLEEYRKSSRSVDEQVLLLDGRAQKRIYEFLEWNEEPENKYYKYDFLYDNCATRIRDVFPNTFGSAFTFGRTLPDNARITFRNIIDRYLYLNHFERFGINLLLGKRIDKVMTDKDVMFLPAFLRNGIGNATVNGQKVAEAPVNILEGKPMPAPTLNLAFVMTSAIAIVFLFSLFWKPAQVFNRVLSNLLLFISGFIGCFILVMWFATDHQGTKDNLNLLWALPTNLFIAFASKQGKERYAIVAGFLLLLSIPVHILRIQEFSLLELGPIMLCLLLTYGMIYRKNRKYHT
ncbi:MAG: DUF4105 domain-containing protein [Sphingobacteriales bacterium]|nr:MAG: DUF4105 domain-containing protein [Sphingobacteriales bacterium]